MKINTYILLRKFILFVIVSAMIPVLALSAEQKERQLEGKTVLISGGTGSLGRKIVLNLANEGANIVFITHNVQNAIPLIEEIKAKNVKASYVTCEIIHENDFYAALEQVVKEFGSIDIAINNAGYGPGAPIYPSKKLNELTAKEWDSYMDNGLKGIFFSMKGELNQMQKQNSGIIFNMANQGMEAEKLAALYTTSKQGIAALTKTAALENSENKNINVVMLNANIKPTFTETEKNALEERIAKRLLKITLEKNGKYNGKIIEVK